MWINVDFFDNFGVVGVVVVGNLFVVVDIYFVLCVELIFICDGGIRLILIVFSDCWFVDL